MFRRFLAILITSCLFVSACAESPPEAEPGSFLDQSQQYRELLESPSLHKQRYIEAQEIVGACMAEQGFDWEPVTVPSEEWWKKVSEFAATTDANYLFTMTEEQARTLGFTITASIQSDLDGETVDLFPASELDGDPSEMSVEEFESSRALYGSESSDGAQKQGCVEQASESVGGLSPPTASAGFEETAERFIADVRYRSAAEEWQSCMAATGNPLGDDLSLGSIHESFLELAQERLEVDEDYFAEADADTSKLKALETEVALESVKCVAPVKEQLSAAWEEIVEPSS